MLGSNITDTYKEAFTMLILLIKNRSTSIKYANQQYSNCNPKRATIIFTLAIIPVNVYIMF
jgi:hypothetical protein